MSQFEKKIGLECCSEVGNDKKKTLKTNLLFSNPFAAENKEMTIVFVPQDPKDPKEAKIKCGGPKTIEKSSSKFDVSVFGLLTLVSIF